MTALLTSQDNVDFQKFLDRIESEPTVPTSESTPTTTTGGDTGMSNHRSALDSLDDAVKQRMAQQAADLKAWMANKSGPPSSGSMPAPFAAQPSMPLPPSQYRAPPVHQQQQQQQQQRGWDMDSSLSAMERMRQAELKAGYNRATTGRRFNNAPVSTSTATAIAPEQVHLTSTPLPASSTGKPRRTNSSNGRTPSSVPASTSRTGAVASTSSSNNNNSAKPALLTEAQKRANHIQSEQRRRAAIREGYDGLCQTVPTLRAAVQDLESRKKGKRKHGVLMGGIEVGGEKIDGRAGPKSEAVVLSKSVEYMRELLDERQALLGRLSDAYSTCMSRGVHVDLPAQKPWEQPWSAICDSAAALGPKRGQDDDVDEDEIWTDQEE